MIFLYWNAFLHYQIRKKKLERNNINLYGIILKYITNINLKRIFQSNKWRYCAI